jgi:glycosyltransferase involved in cell wall biosynthesis
MSRVSLIIPTLRVGNLLDNCIASFNGQYDELIVIDDTVKSLAEKINIGLRSATGDYLIVSNDDIEANTGTLKDLCVENQVVSPKVNGGIFKTFHGHMYCIPRNIYALVGGMDETCPGVYHQDSDLWLRFIKAGYPPVVSELVDVWHRHPASTINTLEQSQRDMGKTREWFVNKWGESECGKVGA